MSEQPHLPERIVEPDGQEMVLVPAGPFRRGREASDIFGKGSERPASDVFVSAFYIDVHPVSNAQMAAFIDEGGYDDRASWTREGWRWRERTDAGPPLSFSERGFDAPDQPVAGVCWFEADAYARWVGRRLPTEAQWEKAARGTDRRAFPWGDAFPRAALCNYGDRVGTTTARGSYPEGVSPYGCHDMAGNVNNWCADWFDADFYAVCLAEGMTRDPVLDDAVAERLVLTPSERADRGGGFRTPQLHWEVLAVTGRLAWAPTRRELWNGFRTAKRGA